MIALPATAIQCQRLPAVLLRDCPQFARDLAERSLPAHGLEATVRASSQRRGQTVAVVEIIRNALRLVAQIAPRLGVLLVPFHLDHASLVARTLQPQLDAAVDVAKIAG